MKKRIALLLVLLAFIIVPASGQESPFSFIMLTDIQFGLYAADKNFVRETANYEFAVATINRLKPGFVIILGDLVNKAGDPGQIAEFLRITKKIDSTIPVYSVAGNHDVGHAPTSESVAAYRKNFGKDYYSFRAGPIYGIVLNSTLIIAPQKAQPEYEEQNAWLKKELDAAKASGARYTVVFQHHPYFTTDPNEPDAWGNIALERRRPMLESFHEAGVDFIFAGHIHRNATAKYRDLEMTAVGPVGMTFGEDESGIRLAIATDKELKHRYFDFGKLPDKLDLAEPAKPPFLK